jgi:hypothetical protein
LQYKDQIYNLHTDAAESFFMDNTYETELAESVNTEKADMVSYLIPKTKECARGLPTQEKTQYKDMIINLLDDYVEYITAVTDAGKK